MSPRESKAQQVGEADPEGRPSERRQELLAIAGELFASKGYSGTTVRDISQRAGILSGSLYHHFTSKDQMAHEILTGFLDDLEVRTLAAVAECDSALALVDRLVTEAFTLIHERPLAVALYQNEAAALSSQPGFEYLRVAGAEVAEVWRTAILRGQASGEFRNDLDARILYRFIRDTVWSSAQWYRPGGSHTAPILAEHFLALLHGGLLARE